MRDNEKPMEEIQEKTSELGWGWRNDSRAETHGNTEKLR